MHLDRRICCMRLLNQIRERIEVCIDIGRFRFMQTFIIRISAFANLWKNCIKVRILCIIYQLIDLSFGLDSCSPGIDPDSAKFAFLSVQLKERSKKENRKKKKLPNSVSIVFHFGSFGCETDPKIPVRKEFFAAWRAESAEMAVQPACSSFILPSPRSFWSFRF